MSRLDWATGRKWSKWRLATDERAYRTLCDGSRYHITHDGSLGIGATTLYLPSPDAALRVANAIAAELGGWES